MQGTWCERQAPKSGLDAGHSTACPKDTGLPLLMPVRGQLAEPVPGCAGILTMLRALGSGCYLT